MTIRAIVTDIEGTTSSIAFVHDVLFPYARERLGSFIETHEQDEEVRQILDAVREESGEPDAGNDRIVAILEEWIDADRKSTALKELQGRIWRHGYRSGDFTGHIYEDAARRLRDWSASGIALFVYSSGSVDAQRLLFGYSDAGDLTPVFSGYFDTRIGHKKEAASYRHIAEHIGADAENTLFLSDVVAELDAAADTGMQTTQLVRDDGITTGEHPIARSFDEVIIDRPPRVRN